METLDYEYASLELDSLIDIRSLCSTNGMRLNYLGIEYTQ